MDKSISVRAMKRTEVTTSAALDERNWAFDCPSCNWMNRFIQARSLLGGAHLDTNKNPTDDLHQCELHGDRSITQ